MISVASGHGRNNHTILGASLSKFSFGGPTINTCDASYDVFLFYIHEAMDKDWFIVKTCNAFHRPQACLEVFTLPSPPFICSYLLLCCVSMIRSHFARVVSKDVASKCPDDLKTKARVAFNYPAKGRSREHLEIATKYLMERVRKPRVRRRILALITNVLCMLQRLLSAMI